MKRVAVKFDTPSLHELRELDCIIRSAVDKEDNDRVARTVIRDLNVDRIVAADSGGMFEESEECALQHRAR